MNIQFFTVNDKIRTEVANFIDDWHNDLPYFETLTSGSTGTPKLITLQKKHASASAKATIDFLGLSSMDKALLCLSPSTIGGKMMIVRSILHALDLSVVDPSANPLKNIRQHFDFIAIAPIQLTTILHENSELLAQIPRIIVGGGVISDNTIELLRQKQISVYQTFGMTETISHIAMRKVGFQTEEYYTTLPGVTVSEEEGALCIQAPTIGQPKLLTNDFVQILSPTQFIWKGRKDFIINSGGVKIQIEELEKELEKHLPCNYFIYKRADDKFGEKVILVCEGAYNEELTQKSFFSFLENHYHIPKEIVFLSNFERTPSGKVSRIENFNRIGPNEFKTLL